MIAEGDANRWNFTLPALDALHYIWLMDAIITVLNGEHSQGDRMHTVVVAPRTQELFNFLHPLLQFPLYVQRKLDRELRNLGQCSAEHAEVPFIVGSSSKPRSARLRAAEYDINDHRAAASHLE